MALSQLFEEWFRLTGTEAEAIAARDWTCLAGCHAAKERLQAEIAAARGNAEAAAWLATPAARARLAELRRGEEQNLAEVGRIREVSAQERDTLDRSRFQLRRLHQTFRSPSASAWHSYS